MTSVKTDWEVAIEYGRHIKGVLPDGTVTGVLAHEGNYWMSYVEDGSWNGQNWVQDYINTPLGYALPAFVDGNEMMVKNISYNGTLYEMAPMESAGFGGWRYEYRRKRKFMKKLLRGEIKAPAPIVFNRYGEPYIEEGYADELDELYWDFIDREYEHKQSHYEVTKSNSAGD